YLRRPKVEQDEIVFFRRARCDPPLRYPFRYRGRSGGFGCDPRLQRPEPGQRRCRRQFGRHRKQAFRHRGRPGTRRSLRRVPVAGTSAICVETNVARQKIAPCSSESQASTMLKCVAPRIANTGSKHGECFESSKTLPLTRSPASWSMLPATERRLVSVTVSGS